MKLAIGTNVTVQTLDNKQITGEIEKILSHTVIVSCGVEKYIVKSIQLKEQGYTIPSEKRAPFSVVH